MAIWTEEDMENQLGNSISMRPLSEKTTEIVGGRNTKAALVTRTNDPATRRLDPKGDRSRGYSVNPAGGDFRCINSGILIEL